MLSRKKTYVAVGLIGVCVLLLLLWPRPSISRTHILPAGIPVASSAPGQFFVQRKNIDVDADYVLARMVRGEKNLRVGSRDFHRNEQTNSTTLVYTTGSSPKDFDLICVIEKDEHTLAVVWTRHGQPARDLNRSIMEWVSAATEALR